MSEYPININVKVGIDWHKACLADRERLANVRDWLNHEYQRRRLKGEMNIIT